MSYVALTSTGVQSAPWWAIPAATLAGVLITVAATSTIEFFRAKRDRNSRLFDIRRQEYASTADLVRTQMSVLIANYKAFQDGTLLPPDKTFRETHREAAVRASLIGSPELVEAVDLQYQRVLEAITAIRRSSRGESGPLQKDANIKMVADRVGQAEKQALQVMNILRKETGVPGNLDHQWFDAMNS